MVVAEVCSTMKYPKRSQYKHAKQKKYHVRNWAEYNERAAPQEAADSESRKQSTHPPDDR